MQFQANPDELEPSTGVQLDEEYRIAEGEAYTKAEFIKQYGGLAEWDAASVMFSATSSDSLPPVPPAGGGGGSSAAAGAPAAASDRVAVAAPAKKKSKSPYICDGDVIALLDRERALYWTSEASSLKIGSKVIGGDAIKLKASKSGPGTPDANQTFKICFVPDDNPQRPLIDVFGLKCVATGKFCAPNFRGRIHCNTVESTKTPGLRGIQQIWLKATNKSKKIKGESRDLPYVRLYSCSDQQYLITHDSLVHRDPRIGMCGSKENPAHCTHYKVEWISRGWQ
jgi:hypothetical protein|tara:strand:+ start:2282 stop:3127 length:846 start_codon:yes stop_codon:yes gene_type:complete